jgi:hypothetical protein
MAKWHPTIHTPCPLHLEFFIREVLMKLVPITNPLGWGTLFREFACIF